MSDNNSNQRQFHNFSLIEKEYIAIISLENTIGFENDYALDDDDNIRGEGVYFSGREGHITVLGLTGCNLKEIPDIIKEFPYLRGLTLNENEITNIPLWITKMRRLEHLNLSNNKLQTIPAEFSYIPTLREILLSENEFEQFPLVLLMLSNMDYIDLRHNSIMGIPEVSQFKNNARILLQFNKVKKYNNRVFESNLKLYYDVTSFEQNFAYKPTEREYDKYIPKSRIFKPLSIEEFKTILGEKGVFVEFGKDSNGVQRYKYTYYPHEQYLNNHVLRQYSIDLHEIEFDFENCEIGNSEINFPKDILGIHTLDNGLVYLGVNSGGDWEIGVYHITYWDGKQLRAYIPIQGNPWNRPLKRTFNNNISETDLQELMRQANLYGIPFNIKDNDEKYTVFGKLSSSEKILNELRQVFYQILTPS